MADGNQHPFNADLVTGETILLFRSQSTFQFQPNLSKDPQLRELADLLSLANSNNSIVTSTHSLSHDDFDRLKSLLRSTLLPIDHPTRDRLWMNILTLDRSGSSKQTSQTYLTGASMANERNTLSSPARSTQWPTFVDTHNLCLYHLHEPNASHAVQHILITFAQHHPDFTYCPALQPLSSLLLHYYSEHDVLFLLDRLLKKNWLCGETRLQWETNVNVVKELFRSHYVRVFTLLECCKRISHLDLEIRSRHDRLAEHGSQRVLSRLVLVDLPLSAVLLPRTDRTSSFNRLDRKSVV